MCTEYSICSCQNLLHTSDFGRYWSSGVVSWLWISCFCFRVHIQVQSINSMYANSARGYSCITQLANHPVLYSDEVFPSHPFTSNVIIQSSRIYLQMPFPWSQQQRVLLMGDRWHRSLIPMSSLHCWGLWSLLWLVFDDIEIHGYQYGADEMA